MVEFLYAFSLRIVTNSFAIASHLVNHSMCTDDSKFGKIGHLTICPVERASRIITTRDADARLVGILRDKGIDIIQV
jgi:DeoR/GlpR family transcriptional regulator of sugar metabolism